MNRLTKTYWTVRAVGVDNIPRRVWQMLGGRLGLLRRKLPGGELSPAQLRAQFTDDYEPAQAMQRWRARADGFFFSPKDAPALGQALHRVVDDATWDASTGELVRQLAAGRMPFFSHTLVEVGRPVNFNRDHFHGLDWPTGHHWSNYVQFAGRLKDIKCVWEPSRFTWAYALARHYVRTRDPVSRELFWEMFDAWNEQNPYGLTAQWACGQESTFRMMAWLFAAIAMIGEGDDPADARRYARLTELVWYTGRHIDGNINYARSQKNNHALSEAVGLITIGLLFPEIRSGSAWLKKGLTVLSEEIGRQVYDDGSYVQHSSFYHRVMMDDLLWGVRICRINGTAVPPVVLDRLDRALDWLLEMIDPQTGRMPNYGCNDGALILPLSISGYLDFRPVAQAAHQLLHGTRCFPPGPWDEMTLWLGGPTALDAPLEPLSQAADEGLHKGGYYFLRGPQSAAMIRCHTYRDRPGQSDLLHLDLRFRGVNVLRDGGSYMYYCDEPWWSFFLSSAGHNVVEIDGQDQMIKGPRFLWFRWPKANLTALEGECGSGGAFEGEHYGYTRLLGNVVHRRRVIRTGDLYRIEDDITGGGTHRAVLRWRLCDAPWSRRESTWSTRIGGEDWAIRVLVPSGGNMTLLRGQETPRPEGWESLYYAERIPVPTIVASIEHALPLRFITLAGPAAEVDAAASGALAVSEAR
jgi:hypothetical protein